MEKTEVISLMEALALMETGKAFNITVVKCDRQRKTGGEIRQYDDVVLSELFMEHVGKRNGNKIPITVPKKTPKAPHHYENATRNLLLPSGDIRKIHIRLIMMFNGKRVLY